MIDTQTNGGRRWHDSSKIIGALAFVLYGCVAWWAAVTHSEIRELQDRQRASDIQSAEDRADLRAIRSIVESMNRKLDKLER